MPMSKFDKDSLVQTTEFLASAVTDPASGDTINTLTAAADGVIMQADIIHGGSASCLFQVFVGAAKVAEFGVAANNPVSYKMPGRVHFSSGAAITVKISYSGAWTGTISVCNIVAAYT